MPPPTSGGITDSHLLTPPSPVRDAAEPPFQAAKDEEQE
jgi:hypothetical protein